MHVKTSILVTTNQSSILLRHKNGVLKPPYLAGIELNEQQKRSFCNIKGDCCTLLMQNVLIPSASLYRTFTGFASATASSRSTWSKKKARWLDVAAVVNFLVAAVIVNVPPFLVLSLVCVLWSFRSLWVCRHWGCYSRRGDVSVVEVAGVLVVVYSERCSDCKYYGLCDCCGR